MQAGRDEDGLVAGAADLEEDQALVLELNLLVVDPARQHHRAVGAKQVVARQTVETSRLDGSDRARAPFETAVPFMRGASPLNGRAGPPRTPVGGPFRPPNVEL